MPKTKKTSTGFQYKDKAGRPAGPVRKTRAAAKQDKK